MDIFGQAVHESSQCTSCWSPKWVKTSRDTVEHAKNKLTNENLSTELSSEMDDKPKQELWYW